MISLSPGEAFAGQTTAVAAGFQIAVAAQRSLRFVLLRDDVVGSVPSASEVSTWVRSLAPATFQGEVSVIYGPQLNSLHVSAEDLWVATHWMTASTLNHFLKGRELPASRAVYVIQDFEPAFSPWSSSYAIAESTYNHGFIPMVNSSSLADFLEDQGHVDFARSYCFSPDVNSDALRQASAEWTKDPEGKIRVLFYGRPAHPRNLFEIGVESLRTWVALVEEDEVQQLTVVSAGTEHEPIDLGRGVTMTSLGKTSLGAYYKLLSKTDMALALMHSPHPGHLPLELPMSGIPTVTNSLGTYRKEWVSRLRVTRPNVDDISRELRSAYNTALNLSEHKYEALQDGALGAPLITAAERVTKIALSSAVTDLPTEIHDKNSSAHLIAEYRSLAAFRAERITSLNRKLVTMEKGSQFSKKVIGAPKIDELRIKILETEIRRLKDRIQIQRRQLRRLNKLKSFRIVQALLPLMRRALAIRRQLRFRLQKNF